MKEPGAAVLRLRSRLPRRARLAVKLRAADLAGNAVARSLGVPVR